MILTVVGLVECREKDIYDRREHIEVCMYRMTIGNARSISCNEAEYLGYAIFHMMVKYGIEWSDDSCGRRLSDRKLLG